MDVGISIRYFPHIAHSMQGRKMDTAKNESSSLKILSTRSYFTLI